MTTTQTTAQSAPLACRGCGLVVKHPDPARAEVLHIHSIRTARGFPAGVAEVPVTRCDLCTNRRELAAELLHDHPAVAAALGDFGLDQLDGALGVLDARGLRPRKIAASLATSDSELAELLSALLSIAPAVIWSEQFAIRTGGQTRRWAHVPTDSIRAAAEAHRRLVYRSVEMPMPYTPPNRDGALRGCLFCGRATITARQREALEAWGPLVYVTQGELGGSSRPEQVAGFICADCRPDADSGGAPGLPAVERALIWAAAGVKRTIGYRLNMPPTAVAWVALAPGTEPNAEPWGHVNLAKLRADLLDLESRGAVRRPLPGEPR